MVSTKNGRIQFEKKTRVSYSRVISDSERCDNKTRPYVKKSEEIKIIHKKNSEHITTGYRKVNFMEQKKRENYKKINKMLGGN